MLIYLLAYLGTSVLVAMAGKGRKMGYWGYLFSSLLLSPFVGALLVLVSAPATRTRSRTSRAR